MTAAPPAAAMLRSVSSKSIGSPEEVGPAMGVRSGRRRSDSCSGRGSDSNSSV
jgi:hypothetical protein